MLWSSMKMTNNDKKPMGKLWWLIKKTNTAFIAPPSGWYIWHKKPCMTCRASSIYRHRNFVCNPNRLREMTFFVNYSVPSGWESHMKPARESHEALVPRVGHPCFKASRFSHWRQTVGNRESWRSWRYSDKTIQAIVFVFSRWNEYMFASDLWNFGTDIWRNGVWRGRLFGLVDISNIGSLHI